MYKYLLLLLFSSDSQEEAGLQQYLAHISDDVVLMPNNQSTLLGKSAYAEHVRGAWSAGTTVIKHELLELDAFAEVVIARGRAVGSFQPADSEDVYPFETKNLFVFRRAEGGELKVWQVIFNMSPPGA